MPKNIQEGVSPGQSMETASEFKKETAIRVLVVEDQVAPQWNIITSLLKYYKDVIPNFTDGGDIALVRSFEELQDLLAGDLNYDVVFLDNTLLIKPSYNKEGKLDTAKPKFDKENLLHDGFKFYIEDGYGVPGHQTTDAYRLIGEFKKRGIVVVGTSSANSKDLFREFGQPDFVIDKLAADPFNSAEENSLSQVKNMVLAAIEEGRAKKIKESEE